MTTQPTPADRLTDAEREAALARDRVSTTLGELQHRLDPRAFARDTIRDVQGRSQAVAQASVATARRNPGVVAGIAAGLGLFVIGRPILRFFRRRRTATRIAPLPAAAAQPVKAPAAEPVAQSAAHPAPLLPPLSQGPDL